MIEKRGQIRRVHLPLVLVGLFLIGILVAQHRETGQEKFSEYAYTGFATGGAESAQPAAVQGPTIADLLKAPQAIVINDNLDADGITFASALVKVLNIGGKTRLLSELTSGDQGNIILQNVQGPEATFLVKNGNLEIWGKPEVLGSIISNRKNLEAQLSVQEATTEKGQLPPAKPTQPPTPPAAVCTDTDGVDAYTKGSSTGPQRVGGTPVTLQDECASYDYMGKKGYYMKEPTCENNIVGTYSITCINGCTDGACTEAEGVPKGQKCQDSDGGDDIYKVGEVTGTDDKGHTYRLTDMCASSGSKDYVLEAICYSQTLYSRKGAYCPDGYGCNAEKTACVQKQATCTPSVEVCDKKDNDCDGQVDEDKVCEQALPAVADVVKQTRIIVIGAKAAASDNIAAIDLTQKYKNLYVIKDSAFTPGSQPAVIVIGGPCVNTAAQAYMGFGKPACGSESTIPEGGSINKVYRYGTNHAVVVAGWNADQTRKAAGQI